MSQGGTLYYQLDQGDFAAITEKLHELAGDKANTYIARALNKTATTARVKLSRKAKASYTVKSKGFKEDAKIDKATPGNLVAVIHSDGDSLSMKEFKFTFENPNPVMTNIVKGSIKPVTKYGNKAFVGPGKLNGHIYVRTGKAAKRYKGMSRSQYKEKTGRDIAKSREGLEKLFSKSVPYMLGAQRVWMPTSPQIESDLIKYMNQQIKLLVG